MTVGAVQMEKRAHSGAILDGADRAPDLGAWGFVFDILYFLLMLVRSTLPD